ncbi:MAG TPA: class I SAM-dependent methyltransferase [Candidatus Coprenecus pullistercoris]|nr:class I SAM-dependent methyltransferase [Candidatus Coprenecus pullistercoris]
MSKDRRQYFYRLATTSRKYYLPYLSPYVTIGKGVKVLEIGCGEGGNLLPFAQAGCDVLGVDLSEDKIRSAGSFFAEEGAEGRFIASDIFAVRELEGQFDLILCHDVIEHIMDKEEFMRRVRRFLRPDTGLAFFAFPAWQMPFGGHQQNCRNKLLSHLPYFHLLPKGVYGWMLRCGRESPEAVKELLEIKQTATPVERFEKLIKDGGFQKVDRCLWLINPHYEVKFGLRPRRLFRFPASIPWLRNFYTTSCFYLLR